MEYLGKLVCTFLRIYNILKINILVTTCDIMIPFKSMAVLYCFVWFSLTKCTFEYDMKYRVI